MTSTTVDNTGFETEYSGTTVIQPEGTTLVTTTDSVTTDSSGVETNTNSIASEDTITGIIDTETNSTTVDPQTGDTSTTNIVAVTELDTFGYPVIRSEETYVAPNGETTTSTSTSTTNPSGAVTTT